MRHTSWTAVEDDGEDPMGLPERPRGSKHATLVGVASGIAAGLLVAAGALWVSQGTFAFGVPKPEAAAPQPALPLAFAAAGARVTDMSLVASSGALEFETRRLFIASVRIEGTPLLASAPLPQGGPAADVRMARTVPLPIANPLPNRNQLAASDGIRTLQQIDQAGAPLPQRNPLLRDQRLAYAALPDPTAPLTDTPAAPPAASESAPATPAPAAEGEVPLPTPGSGFALYDIKGKTVYMPSGERLEAHSGYGDMFDDPRHVSRRMIGPTPPNTYSLTMRESLFHGVEAIRLNPVGTGKMYGRTGILAHTYLLGPRGDSNGCVSFKDYEKFLAAFKRGDIKKMVVVAELPNAPKEQNFLLSWLKPR